MSAHAAAFDCACCGPADRPRSPLAALCDYCASGSCAQCNGLASGADTPGSGYVEMPAMVCSACGGEGLIWVYRWPEYSCASCGSLGYIVDPSHGLTSMSPEWCHYLTLTSEDCRNV